ncbi:unnamed protein product [Parnassius apollo]|uniref:(apollo) hypothetical protein n=1 Tax=Parnassius apollo TaxID=110799 RepID=A0A8S3WGW9_PARAO|nr:unnamed protein product [Parnassius apollo]
MSTPHVRTLTWLAVVLQRVEAVVERCSRGEVMSTLHVRMLTWLGVVMQRVEAVIERERLAPATREGGHEHTTREDVNLASCRPAASGSGCRRRCSRGEVMSTLHVRTLTWLGVVLQ